MGTFTQTKAKQALAKKSKAARAQNKHETQLAALAAAVPADLLCEMQLERRAIASLKGLSKRVRQLKKDQVGWYSLVSSQRAQAGPVGNNLKVVRAAA